MKSLFFKASSRFASAELAWLAFNDRVLEEAANHQNPLLERVKFLSIVSSNLEEFFMIRYAELVKKKKLESKDGFPKEKLLATIQHWVYEQRHRQGQVFDEVCRELQKVGLHIDFEQSPYAEKVFREKIFPFVGPFHISDNDPLPPLKGGRIYLLAKHPHSYSLIELPLNLPRIIFSGKRRVFFSDRLIHNYREQVFQNQAIEEMFSFKVTRDAEIKLDDTVEDILQDMEAGLERRNSGKIVRLEIDSIAPHISIQWLLNKLNVEKEAVYQLAAPLDLRSLIEIYHQPGFKRLRYAIPKPKRPEILKPNLPPIDFFSTLRNHDILLHHPYHSFDPVIELVENAAKDPHVTRICQTLYRTSGKSAILEALARAAKNGIRVTALVEIKARFDEANNIKWARTLEKAGVKVIYGTSDFKIHAKLTYVERVDIEKTPEFVEQYVHIGTGNYHPRTARLYTDLGLLTGRSEYATDAKMLFDILESMDREHTFSRLNDPKYFSEQFKCLRVSPNNLYKEILTLIQSETRNARAGLPARIRAKMNGLLEKSVIEALYKASESGVQIDLLVRGMCALRPGVKGLSENIRVWSIVDKYLEHSRFFIFENKGDPKVWLSSADWMSRNFFKRIELGVPILNPQIRDYLCKVVWDTYASDNLRARECSKDGVYRQVQTRSKSAVRAQLKFEKMKVPHFSSQQINLMTI